MSPLFFLSLSLSDSVQGHFAAEDGFPVLDKVVPLLLVTQLILYVAHAELVSEDTPKAHSRNLWDFGPGHRENSEALGSHVRVGDEHGCHGEICGGCDSERAASSFLVAGGVDFFANLGGGDLSVGGVKGDVPVLHSVFNYKSWSKTTVL